jgi:hypothetical protein
MTANTNGAGQHYSRTNWLLRWEADGAATGLLLTCSEPRAQQAAMANPAGFDRERILLRAVAGGGASPSSRFMPPAWAVASGWACSNAMALLGCSSLATRRQDSDR